MALSLITGAQKNRFEVKMQEEIERERVQRKVATKCNFDLSSCTPIQTESQCCELPSEMVCPGIMSSTVQ